MVIISETPRQAYISEILIKCHQIAAALIISKMRSVSVVLILVVVVVAIAAAYSSNGKEYYDLKDAPALFEQFIKDYNRHYKDIADKYAHFQAFVVSLAKSNKLNFESPTASFGINQFSDYTEEEKKGMFGLGHNNK